MVDHKTESERLLAPFSDGTPPHDRMNQAAQAHAILALVEQVKRVADALDGIGYEDATGQRVVRIVRVSP